MQGLRSGFQKLDSDFKFSAREQKPEYINMSEGKKKTAYAFSAPINYISVTALYYQG